MEDPLSSKLQTLTQELFRIALCRNDDFNLAASAVLKQRPTASKDKVLADLKAREEERQIREGDILKELAPLNRCFEGIERHLRKMAKKCLLLTLDGPTNKSLLSARLPSHLHLAAVMGEPTADERITFGALTLPLTSSQGMTEERADWLVDTYVGELR